jgi:hypothetical protein
MLKFRLIFTINAPKCPKWRDKKFDNIKMHGTTVKMLKKLGDD